MSDLTPANAKCRGPVARRAVSTGSCGGNRHPRGVFGQIEKTFTKSATRWQFV
jgi:hypothetical protein